MGVMPELILSWDGTEYRCRTTMDVIMHVEDKVSLSKLFHRLTTGATSGDIPQSHIAWVYYCLLHSGGAPVTLDDVWKEVKTRGIPVEQTTKVMQFVISEVYGVGPENADELGVDEKKQ